MSISKAAPRIGGEANVNRTVPSKTVENETDIKTYSLARKIFQGLAMILSNIFTLGAINFWAAFRDEYLPVFGISPFTQSNSSIKPPHQHDAIDDHPIPLPDGQSTQVLRHPHFDRIFCGDAIENPPAISVTIPEPVKKSLDIIFGIENVVDRIPTYNKCGDDDFEINHLPFPIMKGNDPFGTPLIFIKFKVFNAEEHYRTHYLNSNELECIKERATEDGNDPVAAEANYKAKVLKAIPRQTYCLILRQKYRDADPLLWCTQQRGYTAPSFLDGYLTYDNGNVTTSSLHDKIPEFQKLFSQEGIGKDLHGIEWTVATEGL
ncbi:MAG: hypothetical protein ACHQUC_00570 [Chlamydiales bacterium]